MIPLALSCLLAAGAPTVDYLLSLDPDGQRVDITLTVGALAGAEEPLTLSMTDGFAYARLEEPLILGSVEAVSGAGALKVERADPYAWTVATGGAAEVTVRYSVGLTHRTLPAVAGRDEYEFPYVDAEHGFLTMGALLMRPDATWTSARRVRFALPDGWPVLAPWPDHPDGGFAPAKDTALVNDLVALGVWEQRTVSLDGFEAVIAAAPGQPGLLEQVAGPLEAIVRAELEIFERAPAGRYLFLFGRPDTRGFAGSPKTASMTLCIDASLRSSATGYVEHLVAHEFFHTWGAARAPLPDELRWVNEGITDWFAYLVPLRLGRTELGAFHQTLADKLAETEANAARATMTLEDAGGPAFFDGGDPYRLVYSGGLVVGAWIDAAIRRRGDGHRIDDLMRAFLNDPRWDESDAQPSADDFLARVAEFAGDDTARRVAQLTQERLPDAWVDLFADVGVELRRSTRPPTLSLRANLDGTTIAGIDPTGLGYRVGLRDGDRLIEINGQPIAAPGDAYAAWTMPEGDWVRVVVERDGDELEIEEPLRPEVVYEVVRGAWDR